LRWSLFAPSVQFFGFFVCRGAVRVAIRIGSLHHLARLPGLVEAQLPVGAHRPRLVGPAAHLRPLVLLHPLVHRAAKTSPHSRLVRRKLPVCANSGIVAVVAVDQAVTLPPTASTRSMVEPALGGGGLDQHQCPFGRRGEGLQLALQRRLHRAAQWYEEEALQRLCLMAAKRPVVGRTQLQPTGYGWVATFGPPVHRWGMVLWARPSRGMTPADARVVARRGRGVTSQRVIPRATRLFAQNAREGRSPRDTVKVKPARVSRC
jgi:hypothetical protein